MKKLISIVLLCTVMLGLAGCVDKEAQETITLEELKKVYKLAE